jgi:electron transfer flavoprotein alpha subunit
MNDADSRVIVVAEHRQGQVSPITYELVACARSMREMAGCEVIVTVLGDKIFDLAGEIAARCGERVVAIEGLGLAVYNAETFKAALEHFVQEFSTAYVCAAHTAQGLDFAPGLAVRLGAACITGVERIKAEQDGFLFSKPTFAGKYELATKSKTKTVVFTVSPGAYAPALIAKGERVALETRSFTSMPSRTRTVGLKQAHETSAVLRSARVIVAAGRGIGSAEGLESIQRLAAVFPGAEIAGSRPLCDQGVLPYTNQIGLTGATIAPDLYFACGISGSRQHTVGITGSKIIVAINLDPDAAIFHYADIGIVENLHRFIPAFLRKYDEMRQSAENRE